MRRWWPVWGGRTARRSAATGEREAAREAAQAARAGRRGRGHSASRPRVARAVAAASAARAGSSGQAGEEMARVWRARESGPLAGVQHATSREGQREGEVLSASLVWATAHAARVSGRAPVEVWAEALDAWLAGWEGEGTAGQPDRRAPDGRRTLAWQAIDATLGHLRAS